MIQLPQEPDDPRELPRSVDEFGIFSFRQLDISEISTKGRYNAVATSTTENDISIGQKYFTLNEDSGKFKVGDDVQITSLDDQQCFMWAEITAVDTTESPIRLTVHVEDISPVTLENGSNWELQVVARPKFGITKDTSTTSIDPTGAGPFTFTVTVSKFFPIGGKLLMIPLADRSIALVGKVKAYSSTSLVVEKNSTNATVSTSYTSWAIALLDAPQDAIPSWQVNGLRVSVSDVDSANDIVVTAGSVRDYSNTVDLILTSSLIKKLDAVWASGTNQGAAQKSSNLAGTVSSAALAVTGTSTAFTTDFDDTAYLADYAAQEAMLPSWYVSSSGYIPITAGSTTTVVDAVTTNTALTTLHNLGATNSTYQRGGPIGALTSSAHYMYAIVLARKDADGTTEIFAPAMYGATTPDLPSGYTYYRVLAMADVSSTGIVITQPLKYISAPTSYEISHPSPVTGLSTQSLGAAFDALPTFESGSYTPTLTNGTNVAASTAALCFYQRIGDIVSVTGAMAVDPTAAAPTSSEIQISLPISSNLLAGYLRGVMTGGPGITGTGLFTANATNDTASLAFMAQSTSNHTVDFHFMYLVA